ncbi:MAG: hypothetical protein M1814_006568, partial [Vezdaea aestivalis]
MSQRTGSNAIPVGTQRPFVSMSGEHSVMDPPSYNTEREKLDQKRRWLTIDEHQKKIGYHAATAPVEVSGRSSKRQSRWVNAADNRAGKLTNLPTMVISRMTNEQLEAFTIDFRIQEISQKLRINDIVPTPGGRSSSPPPQYNAIGHRVNTREQRYRKTLEDERHELIGNAIKVFPGYKTPMDYKPLTSIHEKVYVPVKDFPEINFIGHIIGPRGETLKDMQSKSGSRIVLRGKGSVKGGRGQSRQEERIQLEDDLHCLVIADTHVKVQKAKDLINSIIETAASSPEGQNELKQKQLRRIAEVN